MDVVPLIPLAPAAGAAINALGLRWFGRRTAGAIGCASIGASLLASLWAFAALLERPPAARAHDAILAEWIPPIPLATVGGMASFQARWALHFDPLSAVMALVVTGVALLIHVYATAYMHGEPRGAYVRFFCYLNLFCAFMLTLVLGGNFLVMFVGWEGVGFCSYLLIGYWYQSQRAARAGLKAFLANRLADWGFLLGILLVFFTFGTFDFARVAAAAAGMPVENGGFGTLSLICALLFAGAVGKSAQLPLHVWLPDAMEAPTPVSGLIHAATMVTAGVYIVARNAVLFSHAPLVLQAVAITGVLTALMAATVGLAQTDVKRVLAYSTVSQLGFMFLAAGAGAYGAAIFHLMTHAFFKGLLFLGAGAVIHALSGEQDLRRMGGLQRRMPVTYVTMTIGALAIAAIPPLSGFFSKDAILARAFTYNRGLWALGALTAGLTAVYAFRLIFLIFHRDYRGGGNLHPHDPPAAMRYPLVALAVGAIVAGFIGIPALIGGANSIDGFLAPAFGPAPTPPHLPAAVEVGLMVVSAGIAAFGIVVARRMYVLSPETPSALARRWPVAHDWLLNGYYLDDLYRTAFVRGVFAASRGLLAFDRRVVDAIVDGIGSMARIAAWCSRMFDKYVVDGLVNLAAWGAGEGSLLVRRAQTGLVQNYALLTILGLFAFLTLFLIAR